MDKIELKCLIKECIDEKDNEQNKLKSTSLSDWQKKHQEDNERFRKKFDETIEILENELKGIKESLSKKSNEQLINQIIKMKEEHLVRVKGFRTIYK